MINPKPIEESLVFCLRHLLLKPGQELGNLVALMETELLDKHKVEATVKILLFDNETRAATARFGKWRGDFITVRIKREDGRWKHDRRQGFGSRGFGPNTSSCRCPAETPSPA